MDEPCAGLDFGNQATILRTLRGLARQGYTILMSSHLPDHAFLVSNRVALLKHGRLEGPGSPREVITTAALGDLYGTTVRVVTVKVTDSPGGELSLCAPLMDDRKDGDDDARAIRALLDAGPAAGAGNGPRG